MMVKEPAPQPEAPAAEQWQWSFVGGTPAFVRGHEMMTAEETAAVLNAQQRVLDVNPESPTDATRGVGDDPIPQRECEHHRWWTWNHYGLVEVNYALGAHDQAWCKECGVLWLNGEVHKPVLLPQPIDLRSEAR